MPKLPRKSVAFGAFLIAVGWASSAVAVPVTVFVKDSSGHGIEGVSVRYGTGDIYTTAWFGTTDANGKITGDLDGKFTFQALYRNGSQIRKLDTGVGLKNTVSFRTEEITMLLSACDTGGVGLNGGSIRYGAGSNFGTSHWPTTTDGNGEAPAELFPGIYSFEMRKNGTVQAKQELYVDRSSRVIEWQATNVILDHSGTISYGGGNGGSAWYSNPMYMMPSDVVFQFSNYYSGPTSVSIEGCTFHKVAAIVSVQASDTSGDEVPVGVKWYKWGQAGNKHIVNKKSDAKKVVLLDPDEIGTSGDVAFLVTRNNVNNLLRQDPRTNSIYEFETVEASVALINHAGNPIDERAKVQYYGWGGAVQRFEDSWIEPGNGGVVVIENLLPGNKYAFTINYNYTDGFDNPVINGNEIVTFQTGQVENGSFTATQFYQWGNAANKRAFVDGMELLPKKVRFLDATNAGITLDPVPVATTTSLN